MNFFLVRRTCSSRVWFWRTATFQDHSCISNIYNVTHADKLHATHVELTMRVWTKESWSILQSSYQRKEFEIDFRFRIEVAIIIMARKHYLPIRKRSTNSIWSSHEQIEGTEITEEEAGGMKGTQNEKQKLNDENNLEIHLWMHSFYNFWNERTQMCFGWKLFTIRNAGLLLPLTQTNSIVIKFLPSFFPSIIPFLRLKANSQNADRSLDSLIQEKKFHKNIFHHKIVFQFRNWHFCTNIFVLESAFDFRTLLSPNLFAVV